MLYHSNFKKFNDNVEIHLLKCQTRTKKNRILLYVVLLFKNHSYLIKTNRHVILQFSKFNITLFFTTNELFNIKRNKTKQNTYFCQQIS